MAQPQPRYAPCRPAACAAWVTTVVAPALLGWAFWIATASTPSGATPTPQHVIVTGTITGTAPGPQRIGLAPR